MNTSSTPASGPGYRHAALLYAGREDFVRRTLPFIRAGAGLGEPTLVVVGRDKLDLLRSALDGGSDGIEFADMNDIGANPARIIPAWQDFVAAHPGQRLRGIGEPIYPERSPAELVECQHHERLLNLALDGSQLDLVCPYDTDVLDPEIIAEAHHSHPVIDDNGGERTSEAYTGRDGAGALLETPLPEPGVRPHVLPYTKETLASVRNLVEQRAAEARLSSKRSDDLVLSVHELATNSVRHGGGTGTLRTWIEAGELICEVRDSGRIEDPLVDRRRPVGDQRGGYGLWLANQLCDLVQLRSRRAGSVARLRMRLG